MKHKVTPGRNLLELKPRRNLDWEENAGGDVLLFVPKFRNSLVVKWFVPLLAKPNIKVKLDTRGSFVWSRCDGQTSIGQIVAEMATAFGEPEESLYERIGEFVAKLEQSKFLQCES